VFFCVRFLQQLPITSLCGLSLLVRETGGRIKKRTRLLSGAGELGCGGEEAAGAVLLQNTWIVVANPSRVIMSYYLLLSSRLASG